MEGTKDLLKILEKTFSPEGRRRAGPGQGSGTGDGPGAARGDDSSEGRGSGPETGDAQGPETGAEQGALTSQDHEAERGELPSEIKQAITKLQLLRENIDKQHLKPDVIRLPPLGAVTSETLSAEETDPPANNPPPLEVQLAIVDSLLIMFETPTTYDEKVARAIMMNKGTKALGTLKEEEMTAAIVYMESICKDDEFSAAVYEYMRMYFCKSDDDYKSVLNAEDRKEKTPWKEFKSLKFDDQIVCNGISCNNCNELIKTPDKCGVCGRLVCRPCTWRYFFKTVAKRQGMFWLARNPDGDPVDDDPNIPLLIKLVSFFEARDNDDFDTEKKEVIEKNFREEVAQLYHPVLFQCGYCRSSLYLHGDSIKGINDRIAIFKFHYSSALAYAQYLNKVITAFEVELKKSKEEFNDTVTHIREIYDLFNVEYKVFADKKAYDRIRSDLAMLQMKLDDHAVSIKAIRDKYNLYHGLQPQDDTGLLDLGEGVWEVRLPAFHDDENVVEFLTNPISDWEAAGDPPHKTFSDVFHANVSAYLLDPTGFQFKDKEDNDSDDNESSPPVPVERTYDMSIMASTVTSMINKEIGGRVHEAEEWMDIDGDKFKVFAAKVRDFWKIEKRVVSSAKWKLTRALVWDILRNTTSLKKWAANYGDAFAVYMNGTQTSLTELLKAPRIVTSAFLLANRTEVEFFVDIADGSGEVRNIAYLGNKRILPRYKHVRVAEGGAASVVSGPLRTCEAMTEYVLKKVIVGKCTDLSPDPESLFKALTSDGHLNMVVKSKVENKINQFYKNIKNIWELDAILDIASLLRVVEEPVGEKSPDLLQRLLHAFNVTTLSYDDTGNCFDGLAYTAGVSDPIFDSIEVTSQAIIKGFEERAKNGAKRNSSLAFELALAIVLMRANCSGRNVSFRRLEADLQLPPPTVVYNTVAQDEFLAACGHLKAFFENPGRVEEEEGRVDLVRSLEESSDTNLRPGATVNPITGLQSIPGMVARGVLRPVTRGVARAIDRVAGRTATRRQNALVPTSYEFPSANPNTGPPAPPIRAWRGGDTVAGALFPTSLSGGEGAEKGGASGVSAAAAIFLSLAVVAASALAGALESAA